MMPLDDPRVFQLKERVSELESEVMMLREAIYEHAEESKTIYCDCPAGAPRFRADTRLWNVLND